MRQVASFVVSLAYPFLLLLSLRWLEPRGVALVVLALFVLRALLLSPQRLLDYGRAVLVPALAVGIGLVVSAVLNDHIGLLITPAVVSLALLVSFAGSLFASESAVEKLARAQAPSLSSAEVVYCRSVTKVWCAFFLINAAIALWLAWTGPVSTWAIYTGFVAYLAIGFIFAVEYIYRHWRFRRYLGAPTDVVLKRIFPPAA